MFWGNKEELHLAARQTALFLLAEGFEDCHYEAKYSTGGRQKVTAEDKKQLFIGQKLVKKIQHICVNYSSFCVFQSISEEAVRQEIFKFFELSRLAAKKLFH